MAATKPTADITITKKMKDVVEVTVPVNPVMTVSHAIEPTEDWTVEMFWAEGALQGGPTVLVIRPTDPANPAAGGISQTVLRDIDFKIPIELARGANLIREGMIPPAESLKRIPGLAQGGVTDEYLAHLANAYCGVVRDGQDKPLDHLAELTGKTYAAIKNNLWLATRKGLMERSPGRAGGSLTPQAARLLRASD